MGIQQKVSLRELTQQEREELSRRAKASSERVDVGKKAKAILAIADGSTFTEAGKQAGMSRKGISDLIKRFDQRGLDVLMIAPGRGPKPTYTSQDHELILREVQRCPNWDTEQSLVWSLPLLQKSLRAKGLSHICSETIRLVLQAHGWKYQPTRTWHQTDEA